MNTIRIYKIQGPYHRHYLSVYNGIPTLFNEFSRRVIAVNNPINSDNTLSEVMVSHILELGGPDMDRACITLIKELTITGNQLACFNAQKKCIGYADKSGYRVRGGGGKFGDNPPWDYIFITLCQRMVDNAHELDYYFDKTISTNGYKLGDKRI